jgi:hypothetical protein
LQRAEASREGIRNAFLTIHGSDETRAAPIVELQRQLQMSQTSCSQPQEKLAWLKDVLARALASDPKEVGANLTKSKEEVGALGRFFGKETRQLPLFKEGDEEAYPYALSILGGPIRELAVPKGESNPYAAARRRLADERARKIETITAAIEAFEEKNNELEATELVRRQKLQQQIAAFMQGHMTKLNQAQGRINAGNYSEAAVALQEMLRTAPQAMLGQVLIALSQCTYLNGNATDAARHIQDAICFGASAPVNMDEGYNDLWAKSSAGLPKM